MPIRHPWIYLLLFFILFSNIYIIICVSIIYSSPYSGHCRNILDACQKLKAAFYSLGIGA